MAVIKEKNFTATPLDEIPVADEYRRCNFARTQPASLGPAIGHRILPGDDTPRVFTDCNLMNCEPPPGSILNGCNTWIVETGIIPAAKADDVIEIDGVEISRTTYHDRTVHAKYSSGSYDYTVGPTTTPEDYL